MSLQEVLELGSILQGDDQEKADLERQKMILTSAIKQQEGRFFHEIEQAQRFAEEVDTLKQSAGKIEENLDVRELAQRQASAEVDDTLQSDELIDRITDYIRERDDLVGDLESVLNKFDRILERLKIHDDFDFQSSQSSILSSSQIVSRNEEENVQLTADFDYIEREKSTQQQNIEELRKLLRSYDEERESIKSQYLNALQCVTELDDELSKLRLQNQSLDFALNEFDHKEQHRNDQHQDQWHKFEDEIHYKMKLVDQLRAQYENILADTNATERNRATTASTLETLQNDLANSAHTSQMFDSKLQSANQEVADGENQIKSLVIQQSASELSDFWMKSEQLRFETEMIRSKLWEIGSLITDVKEKIEGKVPVPALQTVLESIALSNEKKENYHRDIQQMRENLLQIQSETSTLREGELSRTNEQIQHMRNSKASLHCDYQNDAKELERARGELSKLQSEEEIEEEMELQMNQCSGLGEKLHSFEMLLKGKEEDIRRLRSTLQTSIARNNTLRENLIQHKLHNEKSTSVNRLKEERMKFHRERVAHMQEELLKEDRLFQLSFKQMEQQLDQKKSFLIKSLEELTNVLQSRKLLQTTVKKPSKKTQQTVETHDDIAHNLFETPDSKAQSDAGVISHQRTVPQSIGIKRPVSTKVSSEQKEKFQVYDDSRQSAGNTNESVPLKSTEESFDLRDHPVLQEINENIVRKKPRARMTKSSL